MVKATSNVSDFVLQGNFFYKKSSKTLASMVKGFVA